MAYTTYYGHGLAKIAGARFVSGAGDAASAISAEAKALALGDILQEYFQARDAEFDDTDIEEHDVRKAILYARGKKHTKAIRKGVLATTSFGLQVAATVGGATVGSVIPGLGTALGAIGGAVAGASLGVGVTLADQIKRKTKGIYKWAKGTRGEHRRQAAHALMHMAQEARDRSGGRNAARAALMVILQDEFDEVMNKHDVARVADRLKSN